MPSTTSPRARLHARQRQISLSAMRPYVTHTAATPAMWRSHPIRRPKTFAAIIMRIRIACSSSSSFMIVLMPAALKPLQK